tara:strand:+ start:11357 stop:12001 length:645 start_codon:yes stop_codon:yes gene_type:complete
VISGAVVRNAVILGLFALGASGLLALTHQATQERVTCNRQAALSTALAQVMPAQRHDNRLREDAIRVSDPRLGPGEKTLYRARLNGEARGVVVEATAPDGYGGAIDLLIGVARDGRVLGVRVVPPHHETPGLGDAIERRKSDWIESFQGHSLRQPDTDGWAVHKDGGVFDAFSGATITPRAVIKAVHRALLYLRDQDGTLFTRPAQVALDSACD